MALSSNEESDENLTPSSSISTITIGDITDLEKQNKTSENQKEKNLNEAFSSLSSLYEAEYEKKSFFGKYGHALKTLIPIRCSKTQKGTLPNENVGLFSYVSLQWMDKWMWKAARRGLETHGVDELHEKDAVYQNSRRFMRLWKEELKSRGKENASFFRTLWRFNRFQLFLAALMMIISCVLAFVGPAWILKYILDFVNTPDEPIWYGVVLVIALSVAQFLRNVAYNTMWVIGAHAGVRSQGAIQVLIYDKVLTIKTGGEKLLSEVINYCTTDIERIYQCMQYSMLITGAPVMWIMNVAYCYSLLGPWSLLGNLIILLYYPAMALVGRKTSNLRVNAVKFTDSRIRIMNQVLSSIKLIKMYAWEKAFSDKIKNVRQQEEEILKTACFLQSLTWSASPILAAVCPMTSIIGLVLTGHNLISSDAFTVISVFSSLQLPMNTVPMAVKAFSEGLVSCRRIQAMLMAEDAHLPDDKGILNANHAISIVNADAAWIGLSDPKIKMKLKKKINQKIRKDMKLSSSNVELISMPSTASNLNREESSCSTYADGDIVTALTKINLIVEKGQLLGICGNVGSGKSSLLSTISGSAILTKGSVNAQGKLAYVTQQAWIFNATVRKNIIFGLPYDEERYKKTVFACCLETDFTLMPNGDLTEIGERGANLSGGQKQRINLARALYSERDIYLLDDALSAVDVKVAKHIFEHCIKNALKMNGKTVLLVTHAIHLLEQCDQILLMKYGTVYERGTHDELIQQNGEYAEMFRVDKEERSTRKGEKQNEDKSNNEVVEEEIPEPDEAPMVEAAMVKEETDKSSSLTWKTWLFYCKQCGGYIITSLVFLIIVVFNLLIVFNSVWLQEWMDAGCGQCLKNASMTDDGANQDDVTLNPKLHMYVAVYGASGVALIVFGLVKGLSVGKVMLRGASQLHHQMFWKIIRSPMSFFDVTPLGRIINRFSRDMDELDVQIPFVGEYCAQNLMLIAFQLIVICVYFYWYVICLVVVLVVYMTFDTMLNAGVRATKRVDNLLRPPLLVHLSATVEGIPVIRCYEKQKMMAEKFRTLVNQHLSAFLLFQLSSKWISFRIDALSWLVITATGFMVIFMKGQVSAAVAGVCMSQMFRVCAVLATVTRWKSELMARLISMERIADYCKNLDEEAPSIIEGNRPPVEWPQEGAIVAKDVELRYRPDLPLVLHGLSVNIKGGEKVGIIGRTGAGKSSVIGTLLRLTELCGGSIVIDEIDISKIGLEDLRSKIAVIPQEPILFEGTVRWNLDPFNVRSEEEIWEALEKSHLKEKISREPTKLETPLNGDSGIFSLGEKQLFCLSRALIRNSKILLLDEATASVDVETDRLIQQTIRDSFAHCTVLTIAHRLNTIADYEKVMGMDAGEVIEFDSPNNLLSRESLFQSMIKSMNESGEH